MLQNMLISQNLRFPSSLATIRRSPLKSVDTSIDLKNIETSISQLQYRRLGLNLI